MAKTETIQAKKNRFLKELEEVGFISSAAKRSGIGRSTVYRWIEADAVFSTQCNDAIRKARSHWNDIVEAALLSRAKDGHAPSIRYWLDNNHFLYRTNKLNLRKIQTTFMDKLKSYF